MSINDVNEIVLDSNLVKSEESLIISGIDPTDKFR
jgi:hypothetical protein